MTGAGTIVGNLADGIRAFGDRPLIRDENTALSYREFAERVEGAAADLLDKGVRPGDRVALCSRNRVESALLIWACARLSAIAVGLPTHLEPDAWSALVHNAAPRLLLAEDEFRARIPGAVPLEDVFTGRRLPWDFGRELPDPDDAYALVYTSGTTGTPKGAIVTHRAAMGVASAYGELLQLRQEDVTPIHLPFSYVSGHLSQLNPIMCAGGSAVLMRQFHSRTLIDVAHTAGATVLDLVPWMFTMLLREERFSREHLPQLRAIIFGGAALPNGILHTVRERFPGLGLFDVYGMSETAGMISVRDESSPTRRPNMLVPSMRARVSHEGELLLRGPLTTPGYWHNQSATKRLLRDEWLHTGDRVDIGADGGIEVHGRVVDMINRGGVKIAPEDVERVVTSHPAVAAAAAWGAPAGPAGDTVAVTVVLTPGSSVTAEELREWNRARLPVHARPRIIQIVEKLPRNPTGKVDRDALRRAASDGLPVTAQPVRTAPPDGDVHRGGHDRS
ncbi:MAG: class I adenylate-forming enzyme family protein [Leifsonia sp.]